MPRLQVESVQGPARRQIIKGLIAFNARAVGKSKYKSLTITLRQGKEIVGGLAGATWMGWLFIDLLWISDKYRGKGHGRMLMKRAEAEALKRGVQNVFLNTFSFQAPGFYKKLGYKEFGKLKNFPAGHTRYWLAKAL
jgi:N-acetylglutamate synthase-like GNAT family acetyltransferase